jgi:hypothetical protein
MDDGLLVDIFDGDQNTLRELSFGGHPDVPQHRARQL